MSRLKISIAYDGTPWQGWQGQPNGLGVQNQMENALALIAKQPIALHGAGRTDTGVHALGMVAHFDEPEGLHIPLASWVKALNAVLPSSIRVLSCEVTAPDFHARFDATGKLYRYRVLRAEILPPLEANRAWQVYGPLDLDLLRQCLAAVSGRHNFARLSANRGFPGEAELRANPENTSRTIYSAQLQDEGDQLFLELHGEGFLYKMVRFIVGAAIHVARGRATLDWFQDLLANPGHKNTQCAPAGGLYLVRVDYGTKEPVSGESEE
jgi:tRNA pseudouridine38-40 synthase